MPSPAPLPPGFRFHPTDEELIQHYLKKRAAAAPCPVSIVAEVDIYKFDPWELPAQAIFGDREWYFFSPRDRKYPNGIRPNRAAASGYWKATGTDKPIQASKGNESIGVKKALVFYRGKPPKGMKTNWIMHEYRLADAQTSNTYKPMKFRDASMRLDDWVLCRIYKRSSNLSPMVSPMEHDIDNSVSEEVYPQNFQNFAQTSNAGLPKPPSISEFLVDDYQAMPNFFDDLPELSAPDQSSVFPNTTANLFLNNEGKLVQQQQLTQGESSNKRMRSDNQRYLEESNGILHQAKRMNDSSMVMNNNFSSQFDSLNQSLLMNQMLLNSRYGKQQRTMN